MIKYNDNTINKWYHDGELIKVYYHGAVCYYKFTPSGQTPCFAVVEDISKYSDTEFEDVFNKADGKWYKLNNLNQYEEYGVYGSGRTITTYEGKLTIDDGYEYEWNGSSWVNLGEVSGSSRVPIGYTEVEYIQNTGTSYLDTNFVPNQDSRIVADMQMVTQTSYWPRLWGAGTYSSANGLTIAYQDNSGTRCLQVSWFGDTSWTSYNSVVENTNRHVYDLNKNYMYIDEALVGSHTYTTKTASDHLGIFTYIASGRPGSSSYWGREHFLGKMYSFQIYDNGTLVRDLVPCIRDNDNTVGAYDIVNDVFYTVPTGYTTDKLIAGAETGTTEYPKYYSEKSEPLDNLTFNTLAEAQAYAEANCVYVGLKATINGDKYVFSGDSQSGYEWVYNPSRLPVGYTEVEYVENTGTSYFNTNFVPNQDTRVVCDMQLVTASNYPRLWGAGAWNSATGLILNYEGGYLQMSWLGNTSWTKYTSVPQSFDRKVYDVNKNYLYVDSVQIGSNTYTTRTASDPIGVFTYIGSGRPSSSSYWGQEHFKGKMYSFQIYDNGTLVRDLVPCIRDNDNTVGAYDIVNDVFYTVPTGYTTDKLVAGDPI